MPQLRRIVRLFERVGARCRKVRGRPVYECWKGNVMARISNDGVVIVSPGEFRVWYSELVTEDGVPESELTRRIRVATGADNVEIDIPCDKLDLKLRFSLDKADRAVEVFEKLADNEMWLAVTNIHGELRLVKKGEPVSTDEWISSLH